MAKALAEAMPDTDRLPMARLFGYRLVGSFAWFVSEPDQIVIMRDGATSKVIISELFKV